MPKNGHTEPLKSYHINKRFATILPVYIVYMAFLCGFCLPGFDFHGFENRICSITLAVCIYFSCNRFVAKMRKCHSKFVFGVTEKRWFMVRFLLFFDIFWANSAMPENVWKLKKPWYSVIGIGSIIFVSILLLFKLQYLFKCCISCEMKLFPVKVVRMIKNNSEPLNIKGSEHWEKLFFLCFHSMWMKKVVRLFCFVHSMLYQMFFTACFLCRQSFMSAGPGGHAPTRTAHSAYPCGPFPLCRNPLLQM